MNHFHRNRSWTQQEVNLHKEKGKTIEMNSHLRDGTIISFPSEFIVKIIDYGRNYFNIDSEC